MDSPNFAAPLGTPVSIVIAGGGRITPTLLSDLMDDWVRLGTDDAVDCRVWLPGDKDTESSAVIAAAYWAQSEGRPGNSIVISETDLPSQAVFAFGEGSYIVSATEAGSDVATALISALTEDNREEQRLPFLILAWGEEGEAPDEFTAQLMVGATEAGIPILEISAHGLQEWTPPAEEEEVAPEPEPVVEQQPAEAQEAPEDLPAPDQPGVWSLAETLHRCMRYFELREEAFDVVYEHDLQSHSGGGMMHRSLSHHLRGAVKDGVVAALDTSPTVEITTVTPEPAVEPPARKGHSRLRTGQASVFLSEVGVKAVEQGVFPSTQDIMIAKGRPRAGWVRMRVDKNLVPAELLEA